MRSTPSKWWLRLLNLSVFSVILVSCASSSDVLTPVIDPKENLPPEETLNSPSFQKLATHLKGLGYDGVGLQYESVEVHELLYKVFSDPKTHNKQLGMIYTGVTNAYDPRYKSLTVGGSRDPQAIINFIAKSVPNRTK